MLRIPEWLSEFFLISYVKTPEPLLRFIQTSFFMLPKGVTYLVDLILYLSRNHYLLSLAA